MSRQARDDKRSKPTKEPNAHYWGDMIFKHIKLILSFLVLIVCILFMCWGDLIEFKFDAIKSIALMSGGFLFGTATSK